MNIRLSLLIGIALAGLLLLQFNWLQRAKDLQAQAYQERLYQLLREIDNEYEEDIEPKFEIAKMVRERPDSLLALFFNRFQQKVERQLYREDETYVYALVTIEDNEVLLSNDTLYTAAVLELGVRKKLGRGKVGGRSNNNHDFYLYLHQLDRVKGVEERLPIILTVLFSGLLLTTFAYTLYHLNRHKKLSELKNDFINNMSHELKTPIATIDLASKTLSRLPAIQQQPKALTYLQLIYAEGTRLENHINKVLQMAMIDSGNLEIDQEIVDLQQIIQQVNQSLALVLQERNGQCEIIWQAEQSIILGDHLLLFHLFYNLLDNAIKYSSQAPIIHIRAKQMDEMIQVEITDEGDGIEASKLETIFERFQRGKRKGSGFGLGLNYVQQVATAHGAELQLESQIGQGTAVKLTFHLAKS